MKAILEFDMPEDAGEHQLALFGGGYRAVIDSALNHIRKRLKYDLDNLCEAEAELTELRKLIYDEAETLGVPLD